MRRTLFLMIILCLSVGQVAAKDGVPFFLNFPPAAYHAHNRNFDVVSDDNGRVYVANFEGLLYYDQTEWHTIHTPGIFRVTKLYKGRDGRIWVGGYNLFGYLTAGRDGRLELKLIFSKDNKGFLGEVTDIREKNGKICVETSIGSGNLEDDSMKNFDVTRSTSGKPSYYKGVLINRQLDLADGTSLLATAGQGLVMLAQDGRELYNLSEENGLCNNNVNSVYVDSLGFVWGATDDGLFLVKVNNAYTHYQESEGLEGEVQSVCHTSEGLYVGTLRGLYLKDNDIFRPIDAIRYACWQLHPNADGSLYASTAGGLYQVRGTEVRRLTGNHTLSMFITHDGECLSGEVDGVYRIRDGRREPLNNIEKATHFFEDADGVVWVRNIYGQVFRLDDTKTVYTFVEPADEKGEKETYNNTLYQQHGEIYVLNHIGLFRWNCSQKQLVRLEDKKYWSFSNQYPQFVYPDAGGWIWATDNESKELRVYSDSEDLQVLNETLRPVHNLRVMAMERAGHDVWFGGNFGLIHWNVGMQEADFSRKPDIYIRQIVINNDSLVWGGFQGADQLDASLPFDRLTFDSGIRDIRIHYSSDMYSTLGDTEYRYRLNNDWSDWSTDTYARFANPRSGRYTFEVMARDRYGHVTSLLSLPVTVRYPIYARWYAILLYVLLLAFSIWQLIQWRMKRLLKEKMRLENIVEERTSQLRQQKDEIEEKSKKLEVALDDLSKAQYQLIRQEKMATVGTLTKGLVDRILNPMNYVNNFSHMSIGLVKDLKDNLEDDREHISPDIFDDSMDALDMLDTNLEKIEEHGLNTTRILKAMEEMLKERTANIALKDIAAICRKNIEMVYSYYAKEIAECHIQLEAPDKEAMVIAEVDAEQFSRTMMSILANSVYAVQKKYQRKAYSPLIRLSVSSDTDAGLVVISIYDNGIGIEKSIIDKVFDPFFTTKTTSEAVGVGMYLSREIILNHRGTITVESEKDEYTEFKITLPIRQQDTKKRNEPEENNG